MNLISLDGVSTSLGEGPLFESVSLGMDEGERVGFVGRNGKGKSTFLRLLAGSLEPDSGSIARKRELSVSTLPQRPAFAPGDSLAGFLYGGDSGAVRAAARRRELLAAGVVDGGGSGAGRELASLERVLGEGGTERLERAYASLCGELGLADLSAPMSSFSGGMVKKAALARALAPAPELLLLDEPTNHLDLETIEWLERRLIQTASAFVLVTHDRWFLDAVCGSIMEIDRRGVYKYEGGYADYLERRLEREAALEKAESRRLVVLRTELAWLARGARARATKSERRKEVIRGMQADALERDRGMEGFTTGRRRLGKKILELEGVSKSYNGRVVLAPFSRSFKAGERVGIVGPNGSGKTTLLDMVAGRVPPDGGKVVRGENTLFAYFDQLAGLMDGAATVLGYVEEHARQIAMADGSVLAPEQLLERFLFPRAMQSLSLSRLSGGELRRLQLVRLLAESPNFLLLDEPTNDLDIDTIGLLEDFVAGFPGCVLVVSHDRAFLDRIADFIIVLDGSGGAREIAGGYADWRALAALEARAAREAAASRESAPKARSGAGPGREGEGRRRLSFAERREYEGILDEIEALERERAALESLFSAPSPDPAAIAAANRRYSELGPLVEARTERWEELEARAGEGT